MVATYFRHGVHMIVEMLLVYCRLIFDLSEHFGRYGAVSENGVIHISIWWQYLAMSLAKSNLLDGLSLPNVHSERLKMSMSVCPITVSEASKHVCRWTSNRQSGAWISCIQNRKTMAFVFHACTMSGSVI